MPLGADARDVREPFARHIDVIGRRVGRIPHRRQTAPPSLIGRGGLLRGVIVVVFSLGKEQLAESPRLVGRSHGVTIGPKTTGLEHHILQQVYLFPNLPSSHLLNFF